MLFLSYIHTSLPPYFSSVLLEKVFWADGCVDSNQLLHQIKRADGVYPRSTVASELMPKLLKLLAEDDMEADGAMRFLDTQWHATLLKDLLNLHMLRRHKDIVVLKLEGLLRYAANLPSPALLEQLIEVYRTELMCDEELDSHFNFQFCTMNFLSSKLMAQPAPTPELLKLVAYHLCKTVAASEEPILDQLAPCLAEQLAHFTLAASTGCRWTLQVQLVTKLSATLLSRNTTVIAVNALVLPTPLLLRHCVEKNVAIDGEMSVTLEDICSCLRANAARPEASMLLVLLRWARLQLSKMSADQLDNDHSSVFEEEDLSAADAAKVHIDCNTIHALTIAAFSNATLEQAKGDIERRSELHRAVIELLGMLDIDNQSYRFVPVLVTNLVELVCSLTRDDGDLLQLTCTPAVVKALLQCSSMENDDALLAQRAAALLAGAATLSSPGTTELAGQGSNTGLLELVFGEDALICSKALLQSTWLADHHNFSALLLAQLSYSLLLANCSSTDMHSASMHDTESLRGGDAAATFPSSADVFDPFLDAIASYADLDHPLHLPVACVAQLLANITKSLEVPSLRSGLITTLRNKIHLFVNLMGLPEATTAAAAGRLVALAAGLAGKDSDLIASSLLQPNNSLVSGGSASGEMSGEASGGGDIDLGKFLFAVEAATRHRQSQGGGLGTRATPSTVRSDRLVALAGLLSSRSVGDPMALLREHMNDPEWDIAGEQNRAEEVIAAAASTATSGLDSAADMVMTVTAQRNVTKVDDAIDQRCPLLLSGPTGVGKSATVAEVARRHGRRLLRVNMSSRMTEQDLLGHLELRTDPRTGKEDLVFVMFQVSAGCKQGGEQTCISDGWTETTVTTEKCYLMPNSLRFLFFISA